MTQKNNQKDHPKQGSGPTSQQSAPGTNYYEILEIAPTAANHEIHRAYQRARETYSQDNPALYSMFSPEEARELLRIIEEAFAVLSNASLRRSYDESLSKGDGKPQTVTTATMASPQPTQLIRPLDAAEGPKASSVAPSVAHLASVHQALPDFASPTDAAGDAFSSRKREAPKTDLAPGMGRTTMSTFKVDDAFEAEIGSTSDFDGQLLLRIRTYKNISLEKMSESTRISRPYLTALEANDYKSLPAAVFVRGFVTQVARNLGIDEVKAAASYMKRFKAGGGK